MTDDGTVIPLHPDAETFPARGLCVLMSVPTDHMNSWIGRPKQDPVARAGTSWELLELRGYEVMRHRPEDPDRSLLEAISRAAAIALTPEAVDLCARNRVWGHALAIAGHLGLEILDAETLESFTEEGREDPEPPTPEHCGLTLTESLADTLRAAAAALREDACADVHDPDRTTLTALELVRAWRLDALANEVEGATETQSA